MKNAICIFSILLLIFGPNLAYAETYYVSPSGGTIKECDGLSNESLNESGHCAVNHIYWIHGLANNPSILKQGDIIHVASGSYEMGFNGPHNNNTSKCHTAWPYDCNMLPLPSNVKILGDCDNLPEFWGSERAKYLFDLSGSNDIILQCLDLTDHADCIEHQGADACPRGHVPTGSWAQGGIFARDSNNVLLDRVKVHGFSGFGIKAGRISNWEIRDSLIRANGGVGWDGDIGKDKSSNSGSIKFVRTTIEYNGCAEGYPDTSKISKCWSQSQGGYGDGLGTTYTEGDWYFEDVNVSKNVSDGIDLLYWKANGKGSVTVKGGVFEKNGGNQFKSAFPTTIDGAIIDGWCSYIGKNMDTWQGKGGWTGNCRALGNSLSLTSKIPGMTHTVKNTTIMGEGDVLIQNHLGKQACSAGNNVTIENSILMPGQKQHYHDGYTKMFWEGYTVDGKTYDCGENKLNLINTEIFDPAPYGSLSKNITGDNPKAKKSTLPECAVPGNKRITATEFRKNLKTCYDRALLDDPCEVFHNTYKETFVLLKK